MATTPKTAAKTRAKSATKAADEGFAAATSMATQAMEKSTETFAAMGVTIPDAVREASERTLAQAREGYARMKASAEETTDLMEETLETAREGILDFQAGTLDAAKAHSDAMFAFMKELMGAQSMADAVQLQTAFARERFEAMVDYSKDLQTRIGSLAEQTSKPAKAAFEKFTAGARFA